MSSISCIASNRFHKTNYAHLLSVSLIEVRKVLFSSEYPLIVIFNNLKQTKNKLQFLNYLPKHKNLH